VRRGDGDVGGDVGQREGQATVDAEHASGGAAAQDMQNRPS
jgi:hypothetical protein